MMQIVRCLMLLVVVLAMIPTPASSESTGLNARMLAEIRALPAPDPGPAEAEISPRNPRAAFLLSLALPGLGQLYNARWNPRSMDAVKAAGFIGFETIGLVQYKEYRDRGWDKQDEYRHYALDNWNWKAVCLEESPYRDTIPEFPGDQPRTDAEWLEFYEDIHKLPKWICGWDDYPEDRFFRDDGAVLIEETPMRVYYRSLRREQNDLLSTSDNWQVALIANHIVSAFEAYFRARRINAGGSASAGLSIEVDTPLSGTGGIVSLAYRF